VKSSGNTVTYPTVKVLDASNFASFTSNVPVYIQYVGTLVQSGNYLNVTIPGVEGKDGSIAYPAEDYSAFYNKEVKVTGFYLGGQTHYSTMVVKLEATDGSGGGDTPTETSLAKIIAAANNTDVETDEVLVVAKYARGVMLQEGSDYLLVYDANGVNAKIGDKVVVKGKKATYSGQAQITTPTVTVKSSGNTVTYPTVKVLDAGNFASFTSNVPVYIQYVGTLVQSGNYLNVTIPGVEGKDGSIAYPAEDYSAFYNKEVKVTGFYLGGQTHYSTMVVKLEATGGSGGGDSGDITTATVAQIKEAEVSDTKLYKLACEIVTIKNTTYGNLKVKDDTGELDVQGLTSGSSVGANDKSFASLNLAVGDKIVIVGVRQAYNDTPQLGSNNLACYFVSKEGSGGGDTGGDTGGSDPYASTLTWTLGANASDAIVKVNGSSTGTAALKLGTSSKAGTATLTVPAGASKISFYGLGWKGKTATLTVKLTGMTDKQAECTANEGVANNSPFTVTVAGTDKKTIDLGSALGSAATVTVTTEGSTNTRVVLFGFVSE
jgi:hypothetical protein